MLGLHDSQKQPSEYYNSDCYQLTATSSDTAPQNCKVRKLLNNDINVKKHVKPRSS